LIPRRHLRIVSSALAVAGLAACSAGIQVGKATSGDATSGPGPIGLGSQTGYTPVTASDPNPCELDLDFGTVPIGVTSSAVVEAGNNDEPFDLSIDGALDPEFSLLSDKGLVPPGSDGEVTATFGPVDAGTVSSSFTLLTNDAYPPVRRPPARAVLRSPSS